jgi:hypothetical protein
VSDIHDPDDPQAVYVALGVAILALNLIADDRLNLDPRLVARSALRQLREKYNATPDTT